jgi:hypothetical protein
MFLYLTINNNAACKLQKPVLKGVITGSGIQCFCSSCNGTKVSISLSINHQGT